VIKYGSDGFVSTAELHEAIKNGWQNFRGHKIKISLNYLARYPSMLEACNFVGASFELADSTVNFIYGKPNLSFTGTQFDSAGFNFFKNLLAAHDIALDFSGVTIHGQDESLDFTNCNLTGATLRGVKAESTLHNTIIDPQVFRYFNVPRLDSRVDGRKDFSHTHLAKASYSFWRQDLSGLNFSGAVIDGTFELTGCRNVDAMILTGAKLSLDAFFCLLEAGRRDFAGVDLSRLNLASLDLTKYLGLNLAGANLQYTNCSGSKLACAGIVPEQLQNCHFDEHTTAPGLCEFSKFKRYSYLSTLQALLQDYVTTRSLTRNHIPQVQAFLNSQDRTVSGKPPAQVLQSLAESLTARPKADSTLLKRIKFVIDEHREFDDKAAALQAFMDHCPPPSRGWGFSFFDSASAASMPAPSAAAHA
jgi:uncharacterized protein YjbI with pentapeptide repeats